MIIDFHAHIYPPPVAAKILPAARRKLKVEVPGSGAPQDLLGHMSRSGIARSILLPLAKGREDVSRLNDWILSVSGEGLIPFGAIHPFMENLEAELDRLETRVRHTSVEAYMERMRVVAGHMIGDRPPHQRAPMAFARVREFFRRHPHRAHDALVETTLGVVPFRFGGEGEAEVVPAAGAVRPQRGLPLIGADERGRADVPAGFFPGFADRGVDQAFVGLQMSCGLVQD